MRKIIACGKATPGFDIGYTVPRYHRILHKITLCHVTFRVRQTEFINEKTVSATHAPLTFRDSEWVIQVFARIHPIYTAPNTHTHTYAYEKV